MFLMCVRIEGDHTTDDFERFEWQRSGSVGKHVRLSILEDGWALSCGGGVRLVVCTKSLRTILVN